MLRERTVSGAGEMMSQEIGLVDGKLTFSQANRQAMSMAQIQDVSEVLNMS